MENLSHNVKSVSHVLTPEEVDRQLPLFHGQEEQTIRFRKQIARIISGECNRRIVILGPCSIHDTKAALEYAKRIKKAQDGYPNLLLVMRVYFEKPRTTTGWKGFINDPNLDGSFEINEGLMRARAFLIQLSNIGVPAATEFLDPITPIYFRNLFAWGAIGARTMESQIHREIASGLPMPIGFKNPTSGSLKLVANSIKSANAPHSYLGIDKDAKVSVMESLGNPYAHTILRGSDSGSNYDYESLAKMTDYLEQAGVSTSIIVDCSHANCGADFQMQTNIARFIFSHAANKRDNIKGIMLESFIKAGRQDISDDMEYGLSITDPCIDLEDTLELLGLLNERWSQKLEKDLAES